MFHLAAAQGVFPAYKKEESNRSNLDRVCEPALDWGEAARASFWEVS